MCLLSAVLFSSLLRLQPQRGRDLYECVLFFRWGKLENLPASSLRLDFWDVSLSCALQFLQPATVLSRVI